MLNEETDRDYLKIQTRNPVFSLGNIGYEYLYIILFNEKCLACADEAAAFKKIYQQLLDNPYLSDRVRLMGIGAGSKKRGIIAFKKENDIPYPLFGDEKQSIFTCLGKPVLPTSYLIQLKPGGKSQILFVQQDHIQHVETLIKQIDSLVKSTDLHQKHN